MEQIKPMVDIQRHRGPDSEGFLLDGPLAMGMRRLSIIDLAGGSQPIFNEDGTVGVILNGEVYNYSELREYLMGRGHRFVTRSDTEVVVHLYEEHGTDLLPHLNGMFAFAVWDNKQQVLLLARDRMGVKPLYYLQHGSRWLFASELKSLLTQCQMDDGLDLDSLADFLRLTYIPREHTPYRAVRRLLPGHLLLITREGERLQQWWDLAAHTVDDELAVSASIRHDLESSFDDAVRLRMRSDVPVASFLSGGLDSSLVTVTAARHSSRPINTFTIAFENTDFDETPYARAVATTAGTAHHERVVSTSDAIERLPLLIWHMDEPLGDSSIVPNYLVSRFAAEQVKVCLSGLGGDELFGGYSRYAKHESGRIRRLFAAAPVIAGRLAPSLEHWSYARSQELYLASSPEQEWRDYLQKVQIFNPQALETVGFPAAGRATSTFEGLWRRYPDTDYVGRRQFIDQHTYLPDQILALTDRMSMANSLEVRVPFMDYRLVRLAQAIPGAFKHTSSAFKIALKQVLGDRVPAEVRNRPKWGFDTPLSRWVRQPSLYSLLRKLRSGEAVRIGLLRRSGMSWLLDTPEHASRYARHCWNLLVLEVWLRVRRRGAPPSETLPELLA